MKKFHAASLDSDRIQRIINALAQSPGVLTTMDLNMRCGSTRSSSDCSEARQALALAGKHSTIKCKFDHTNPNTGRKIYRYFLV